MLGSWVLDWFVYLNIATLAVATLAWLAGLARGRR